MIISRTSCLTKKSMIMKIPTSLPINYFLRREDYCRFRITVGSADVNQTSFYETAASVRMIITIFRTLILMAVNVSVVSTCFIIYYILLGRILQLPRGKGHKRTSRSHSKVPHLTLHLVFVNPAKIPVQGSLFS